MSISRFFALAISPLLVSSLLAQARNDDLIRPEETDGDRIRQALDDLAANFWIYEDVASGFAESRRTGKPLLLSIR